MPSQRLAEALFQLAAVRAADLRAPAVFQHDVELTVRQRFQRSVTVYLLDPFVGDTQRIGEKISLAAFAGTIALGVLLLPTPNVPNSFGETHSLNGPCWTLFQEYIANVLYGLFGHRLTRRLHIGLCVLSAAVLLWTAHHFNDLSHGWGWADFWAAPVRLACPFLAGLLVYRTGFRLSVPQSFVVLSLVLAAGAGVTRTGAPIGALCRFMGELSYPVYVVHYAFVYLFAHWNWTTHPSPMRPALVAAGSQIGIVMLAYALLRWFDRPVHVPAAVAEVHA